MRVFSVRKGGWDVNEFSREVLCLNPDGITWRTARPDDLAAPANLIFGGYNNKHEFPADNALDAARSIESLWRQLYMRYEPVCCLWPGLGENRFEALRFHKAIRHARRSGEMYAQFLAQTSIGYMLMGHSLGCGLTGFLLDHIDRPADLTVWMGAAVPQYATAAVDPKKKTRDLFRIFSAGRTVYDFADAIATKTKTLVNVYAADPVVDGPFELAVRSKGCGAHGAWPGPERLPNVIDIDFRRELKSHGAYRHYLPMWQQLREHVRSA